MQDAHWLTHHNVEDPWDSVWARPGLDRRRRLLVTLAVLTTLRRPVQLRSYLDRALASGLSPIELEEVLIQCSVFSGFPATAESLEMLREEMEKRDVTREGSGTSEVASPDWALHGRRLETALFGEVIAPLAPVRRPAQAALAGIMTEYVFGEIFHRPGLELSARVTCMVATAVALRDDVELRRWLPAARRVGLSREEVDEILMHTGYYAGFPAAMHGMALAAEILPDD